MKDYKLIADVLQKNPVDNKVLTKEEFTQVVKKRKLVFIQDIDTVNGVVKREVWGNKNFETIVLHEGNNYQFL